MMEAWFSASETIKRTWGPERRHQPRGSPRSRSRRAVLGQPDPGGKRLARVPRGGPGCRGSVEKPRARRKRLQGVQCFSAVKQRNERTPDSRSKKHRRTRHASLGRGNRLRALARPPSASRRRGLSFELLEGALQEELGRAHGGRSGSAARWLGLLSRRCPKCDSKLDPNRSWAPSGPGSSGSMPSPPGRADQLLGARERGQAKGKVRWGPSEPSHWGLGNLSSEREPAWPQRQVVIESADHNSSPSSSASVRTGKGRAHRKAREAPTVASEPEPRNESELGRDERCECSYGAVSPPDDAEVDPPGAGGKSPSTSRRPAPPLRGVQGARIRAAQAAGSRPVPERARPEMTTKVQASVR